LPFQLPNDFLFLIRALSLISGVASTLNREFNIWDAIDPFARSLLNGAGSGVAKNLGKELLSFATTVGRLPGRVDDLISRFDAGQVIIRNPELETRIRVLDSSVRRGTSGVVFAALLIAGIILLDRNEQLGYTLMTVSAFPMLHALGLGRLIK